VFFIRKAWKRNSNIFLGFFQGDLKIPLKFGSFPEPFFLRAAEPEA
jgi:hypothetical protein